MRLQYHPYTPEIIKANVLISASSLKNSLTLVTFSNTKKIHALHDLQFDEKSRIIVTGKIFGKSLHLLIPKIFELSLENRKFDIFQKSLFTAIYIHNTCRVSLMVKWRNGNA